ncbi:MAG: Txe/YoeB family addiction module toxin [Alphaproteobacteria bacterium]|nr:Txe/YoeB family addiction module toxin [Alphaproteobacteria bacterium]
MLSRVVLLLDGVLLDPRTGLGKPERLKHYNSREVWSRRIDKKNRLVYEIRADEITILSVFGHYVN